MHGIPLAEILVVVVCATAAMAVPPSDIFVAADWFCADASHLLDGYSSNLAQLQTTLDADLRAYSAFLHSSSGPAGTERLAAGKMSDPPVVTFEDFCGNVSICASRELRTSLTGTLLSHLRNVTRFLSASGCLPLNPCVPVRENFPSLWNMQAQNISTVQVALERAWNSSWAQFEAVIARNPNMTFGGRTSDPYEALENASMFPAMAAIADLAKRRVSDIHTRLVSMQKLYYCPDMEKKHRSLCGPGCVVGVFFAVTTLGIGIATFLSLLRVPFMERRLSDLL